ncbi:MAG: hypothetical protein ABI640_14680 [Gammaproteobacteria bacterium]
MRTAAVSLAVIALSVLALARPAVAQDATKVEPAASAASAAKPPDATSDRQQRRERRQAEAAAKQAEADAAKSETLAKFPNTEEANAAAAKPKMVCRKQAITGSRLGKNICATPEQWAQTDARAAETTRQMRNDISEKSRIAGPASNPLGGVGGR